MIDVVLRRIGACHTVLYTPAKSPSARFNLQTFVSFVLSHTFNHTTVFEEYYLYHRVVLSPAIMKLDFATSTALAALSGFAPLIAGMPAKMAMDMLLPRQADSNTLACCPEANTNDQCAFYTAVCTTC